ncbi:sensory box sensor histidine kianse/response regulator [Pseudooceanicola batsensis HTCC2597]|uniref:histidine kinase n=2 Tax=Pseudooceanicola batsensis TaxID=314255 RepID=A3TWS6_PSEBH|nr:sensory box sensor histidine kianse/response regulator [Pseudooceanicola batsensis HTCC2597]
MLARRRVSMALLLAALPLLAVAQFAPSDPLSRAWTLFFVAAAATLLVISGGIALRVVWRSGVAAADKDEEAMDGILDALPGPALVTTRELDLVEANAAARDSILAPGPGTQAGRPDIPAELAAAMADMADPAARHHPSRSREVTAAGKTWTLMSRRLGENRLLWQFAPAEDATGPAGEPPILTLDPRGAILEENDPARRLFGAGGATALADLFLGSVPSPGRSGRVRTPSGERPVLLTEWPTDEGKAVALIPLAPGPETDGGGTHWDHFENLPVPLLWISPEGRVQRANRNAVHLIGPGCRSGAHLRDLTEGLGRPISDWLDEAKSGHRANSPEFLRVTGSDSETFVQITLKPLADGEETSLLAVLNDATELKTLEAQFVQSQKMQAIGQLAGGVAHDFNNLLTAISGHCDLLLLRHDQGDPEYADLMQINQNANRAAALVNQLLAFSRKQTLRPEEVDLRETISDLTHLLNRLVGEKVTLSFSHDPVLNAIRADKRQLEQVLMNLVVNARDAISGTGEIRIVTEGVALDAAQVRDRATIPPGDYVSVKVIDTGCGIPPDKLSKVFEPFYTTKRVGEGTGLGLSTAYGIIKQTGGYIFADSAPGQGTCFTLLFRAFKSDRAVMDELKQSVQTAARHADGVVLLVEDEAPVRAFASRALRLRGYTVLEAESGEEALEILEDGDLTVDIFVTDVVMPGMDGPTWVREALETRPEASVIFVSGYAEEHFGDAQSKIPNSVFLPKPFSLSELTRTVQGLPR